MNWVMRLASVKREDSEVAEVAEPFGPVEALATSGNAGSPISSGDPESSRRAEPGPGAVGDPSEDTVVGGSAVSTPVTSRAVVAAARRRVLPAPGGGSASGGTRGGRRRPGNPVPRSRRSPHAPCARCTRCAVCSFCPGCMPSGCAPSGPARRERHRPCGKRSREVACGDRNDSECRRIRLGSGDGPVVASPRSILRIAPASVGDEPGMLTSRACTRASRDVPPGDTVAVPVIMACHGERVAVRRRRQAPSASASWPVAVSACALERTEPRGTTQREEHRDAPERTAWPSPE